MSDKYAALRASITAAIEKVEAAHEATERTSVARREGLVRAHKMYQQERDRAEAAEKRVAELLAELDADKQRIAELKAFHTAYLEWHDKTEWVQTDKRFDVLIPWGKHRADVLKEYIHHLEARTLTVKLPPEVQGSNIPFAADGANAMRKEVVKALTYACAAAGISLKIEGE